MAGKSFLLHFRPHRVRVEALNFSLTFGLGGIALVMIGIQFITGLLLSMHYQPGVINSYLSVEQLNNQVVLGRLVRNLHHWCGHGLIVVLFLHLFRIVWQGALYEERKSNWWLGLCLYLLVFVGNFSGYLLPWDQLAYWAVTVATSLLRSLPIMGDQLHLFLRGGEEVGAPTLSFFHTLHTMVVPVGIFFVLGYHLWLVRKNGGVFIPEHRKNRGRVEYRPFSPDLLVREWALTAATLALLVVFSMIFDAPLGDMANSELTPDTVRAPWYFLGVQELLLHVSPLVAVGLLPLFTLLLVLIMPYFTKSAFPRQYMVLRILFFLGCTCFLALTFVGNFFRGPGMKLVLPW